MSSGLLMLAEHMSHLHKAQGLRLPQFYFCWHDKNTLTKGPSGNRFVVVQWYCLSQWRRWVACTSHPQSGAEGWMLAAGTCLTSPSYTSRTKLRAVLPAVCWTILAVTCAGQPDTDSALVETSQESLDCARLSIKINHHRCPAHSHTKC